MIDQLTPTLHPVEVSEPSQDQQEPSPEQEEPSPSQEKEESSLLTTLLAPEPSKEESTESKPAEESGGGGFFDWFTRKPETPAVSATPTNTNVSSESKTIEVVEEGFIPEYEEEEEDEEEKKEEGEVVEKGKEEKESTPTPVSFAPTVPLSPSAEPFFHPVSLATGTWEIHIPISSNKEIEYQDSPERDMGEFNDVMNFNDMELRNGIYVHGSFSTILGKKVKLGYVEELTDSAKGETIRQYLSGRPMLEGTYMQKIQKLYAAVA
jgi:hypothetical protein